MVFVVRKLGVGKPSMWVMAERCHLLIQIYILVQWMMGHLRLLISVDWQYIAFKQH